MVAIAGTVGPSRRRMSNFFLSDTELPLRFQIKIRPHISHNLSAKRLATYVLVDYLAQS